MIDVVKDIEILEEALIGIKEGASDEKRMAINSLEKLLAEKRLILETFEKEMAPKDPHEHTQKEPFQRWK